MTGATLQDRPGLPQRSMRWAHAQTSPKECPRSIDLSLAQFKNTPSLPSVRVGGVRRHTSFEKSSSLVEFTHHARNRRRVREGSGHQNTRIARVPFECFIQDTASSQWAAICQLEHAPRVPNKARVIPRLLDPEAKELAGSLDIATIAQLQLTIALEKRGRGQPLPQSTIVHIPRLFDVSIPCFHCSVCVVRRAMQRVSPQGLFEQFTSPVGMAFSSFQEGPSNVCGGGRPGKNALFQKSTRRGCVPSVHLHVPHCLQN
mmetsp:Transcript_33851/g.83003  ORF Transcript_33851/g.83003 Transcript_33851/m.83003 type:complete len:259 (-) Transcript_33851:646-1422(-)